MTIDSILKKCLRDSGAEGFYCIAVAKSAIRDLVMMSIPKNYGEDYVDKYYEGYDDCLAEVRARLGELLK